MDRRALIELSKTLSRALRHEPWIYELELDEEGWVSVEEVLAALRRRRARWADLDLDAVKAMMRQADKQRFELQGAYIRARYGHSLPGKLKKVPAPPPDALYHGTSPQAADLIRAEGLKPMGRQYVHLSVDVATAQEVGRRKDREPILLIIQAGQAYEQGVTFYEGNDKVWLADHVPPSFIAS